MTLMELVVNFLSLVCLLFGLYFAIKLKERTKSVSPAWLLISVGLAFLAIYALTNIIEFANALGIFGENVQLLGRPVGDVMDHIELAVVPAGASFLAAAGLALKQWIANI